MRRTIPFPNHLDVAKPEPFGPSGPQGLQASFLRREPGGEGQEAIGSRVTCRPLPSGEHLVDQAVPVPAERVGKAAHFDDVDS
jgi:hypothetical protein